MYSAVGRKYGRLGIRLRAANQVQGMDAVIRVPGVDVYMLKYTRGASPWRADARLGSAHARDCRGCIIIGKSRP